VIAQDEGQEAHPLGAFYLFGALGKNSPVENGGRTPDRWHMLADVPADGYERNDTTEYDWGAAS